MLRVTIVTIFPDFFTGPLSLSIPAKAATAGSVTYKVVDLREYTHDRHRTVDDYPYGGGPGMVMKPEPFFEAIDALETSGGPIALLSARGRPFSQADASRFAAGTSLTLLCGHYKDVDQRRRASGARRRRRNGAPAAGGDVGPRQRTHRLVLRAGYQCTQLHATAHLPWVERAGGAAVGGSQADRGMASRGVA
jgi:hypothetical protein